MEYKYVDLDSIQEAYIDVNEYCKEYREWLNNSNLLKDKGAKANSEATFDSKIWIFYHDIEQKNIYLDFNKLLSENLKRNVTEEDIIILKCWLVEIIRDDQADLIKVRKGFNRLCELIEITNNFTLNKSNLRKGDAVKTFLETTLVDNFKFLTDYIYFLSDLELASDEHLIVLEELNNHKNYREPNTRILPESRDVITFHYYLNRFFTEEHNQNLINYYKPLLLWWKITNIIPMRPSEFTTKLKRSCLITENDEYYLEINRVKLFKKVRKKSDPRIPILKRIRVTKELAELISDYINSTLLDTDTKSLISYASIIKFRNDYISESEDEKNVMLKDFRRLHLIGGEFGRVSFSFLLDNFYDAIIEKKYNDFSIKRRLRPGDTRHLAFMSLLLQGISPIEIAMMGGHTTLASQDFYVGHVEYYIDSEVINYINSDNFEVSITEKKLKEIIMNKSWTCPKFIIDCTQTEDGVGYCTLDMSSKEELCDNVEFCIYCKKWWCEPTNENYIKVKNYIQNEAITPIRQAIKDEESFLGKLLSQAKIINVGNLAEIDKNDEENIKQVAFSLKSNADKIIFYKKSLLEKFNESIKEIE